MPTLKEEILRAVTQTKDPKDHILQEQDVFLHFYIRTMGSPILKCPAPVGATVPKWLLLLLAVARQPPEAPQEKRTFILFILHTSHSLCKNDTAYYFPGGSPVANNGAPQPAILLTVN